MGRNRCKGIILMIISFICGALIAGFFPYSIYVVSIVTVLLFIFTASRKH